MRFAKALVACMLATSLSGCYTMTYSAGYQPEGATISLTRNKDAKVAHRFRAEERGVWLAGGLLPLMTPNATEMIRKESMGQPVQGLVIQSQQSFLDGALTVGAAIVGAVVIGAAIGTAPTSTNTSLASLALSLLIPTFRTVTVDGEVVESSKK